MRTTCLLLILCLLLPLNAMGEEQGFHITAPQRLRPYGENQLTVHAPIAGELTITYAQDGRTGTVVSGMAVDAGASTIPWAALAAHGEPLSTGAVTINASLNGQQTTVEARVGSPVSAVQFAVASSDTIYAGNAQDFHVWHQLSAPGLLRVQLVDQQGQELRSWSLKRDDANARTFRFDGTLWGKMLNEGSYTLLFSAGKEQAPLEVPFAISHQEAPVLPVTVTDPALHMPKSRSPQDVWAAMIAPITVVDIGALAHQNIKDENGKTLGAVHGQTSGVQVLSIENGNARVGAWRTEDGCYIEGYIPVDKLKVITPHPRYGVLIDKQTQTMTIYENGSERGTLRISTGLPTAKKLFRETVAGAFLTERRVAAFSSEGYRYNYPIRFDGGNFIHELGWSRKGGYADQEATLGSKVSHGCVRVERGHTDDALNAYWLWANLPTGTKVLVLDDPAQRAAHWQSMFPGQVPPDAEPLPTQTPPPATQPPIPSGKTQKIVMTFGGDCVLGSEENKRRREDSFDSFIAAKGYGWPFELLQPIFTQDDWTVINLECVFKDDSSNKQTRLHNFRGPVEFANILPVSSVEMVNIANNHHIDYGKIGRRTTKEALDSVGVAYAGYGDIYVWQRDGIKIGFGGIRETTWRQNKQQVVDDIQQLKAQGGDLIIYSCHFGKEYAPNRNQLQERIAHMAIDEGADIIIGHHPHVVQGVEHYNGGVIFYSLGNLVFGGNLDLTEFDGCLVQTTFTFVGNTCTAAEFELIPVLTSGAAPANDFRPVPAQGEDKLRIISRMQQDSVLPLDQGVLAFTRLPQTGFALHTLQQEYVVNAE